MADDWSSSLDPREIIEQLGRGSVIDEWTVFRILYKLTEILFQEANVVEVQSPVIICGHIHGQYEDLLELFRTAQYDILNPDDQRFIFMGDYVDRGKYSLNTILLLAVMKIRHPHCIFLLRGNHESRQATHNYGFRNEILLNYGYIHIYHKCMEIFDLMPIVAVTDSDVISVHGGLSPELWFVEGIHTVYRCREIPPSGLIADLMWSDPEDGTTRPWCPNTRGRGWVFGREPTLKFCHINRITLITRSHQVVQDGFKWYFTGAAHAVSPGPLIDVWSAPKYSGRHPNIASIMRLRYEAGDPYYCPTFDAVPGPNRIAEQDIEPSDYFD
jgi:diadenosine tetraphosphatase ApaH/serine/threonine PP2A family protein phosphatase